MEAVDYHSDPAAHAEAKERGVAMFTKRSSSTIRHAAMAWHPDVHGPQITISNGGRTVYQVIAFAFPAIVQACTYYLLLQRPL